MDIAGAKALKTRLGSEGTDEAPPTSGEVAGDVLPVYRWLGLSRNGSSEAPANDSED